MLHMSKQTLSSHKKGPITECIDWFVNRQRFYLLAHTIEDVCTKLMSWKRKSMLKVINGDVHRVYNLCQQKCTLFSQVYVHIRKNEINFEKYYPVAIGKENLKLRKPFYSLCFVSVA